MALNFSIRAVTARTGLSPHVIRVWERRYGAVKPARTGTNRRVYAEADVERLSLLRRATDLGHSISQVAKLPDRDLKRIVDDAAGGRVLDRSALRKAERSRRDVVDEMLAAVERFDSAVLDELLGRAIVVLGREGLLRDVIAPLITILGEMWAAGKLRAAHEHFASAALRTFLANSAKSFAIPDTAPAVIVATPAGQLHELGASIVAAVAVSNGWRAIYLGPSLPASEIAGAALQNGARAVALSIVYPEDDPTLPGELALLRRYLPKEIAILAGGRAAPAYREALKSIGAIQATSLDELNAILQKLRSKAAR